MGKYERLMTEIFIAISILFILLTSVYIGKEVIHPVSTHKINCPEYPTVDGAGKPEVCK